MTGYLRTWRPVDGSRPLLLCLPQAGAGVGAHRSWVDRYPDADVVAVLLPGREDRFTDAAPRDVDEVVTQVVRELATVRTGQPLVVFGDSFGGLLGYEIARRVAADALVVVACRAPRWWSGAGRGISRADVEELVDARTAAIGLDEDSRDLLTEVMLADAALSESYLAPVGAGLSCPVHAWGGRHDETVTAAQLDDWIEVAWAGLSRRDFDAGHDVVRDRAVDVAAALDAVLAAVDVREAVLR